MITNDFLTKITPATVVGKQRAYVNIPVFSAIDSEWLGASRLVVIYNYSATNNFTISSVDVGTESTSEYARAFIVCIKWKDVDGNVHRYKLLDNPNGILYVDMYDGEIIKKEFSIEIWSVDNVVDVTSNSEAITINLSILRARTTLSDATTYENVEGILCDNIYASSASSNPVLDDLIGWWDGQYGITADGLNRVSQWLDKSGNGRHLVPYSVGVSEPLLVNNPYIPSPDNRAGVQFDDIARYLVSIVTTDFSFGTIFMLVQQVGWTLNDNIAHVLGVADASRFLIKQSPGTPSIKATEIASGKNISSDAATIAGVPPEEYFILRITNNLSGGPVSIQVSNLSSILDADNSTAGTTAIIDGKRILFGSANFILIECLAYDVAVSDSNSDLIHEYLNNKYGLGIPAPFQFAACAAGTNNI